MTRKKIPATSSGTFYNQKEIIASISEAKKDLQKILDSLLNSSSTISYGEKICSSTPLDFHRMLLEWPRESGLHQSIRNIILSALFSSEVLVGGAAFIACAMWLEKFSVISTKKKVESVDIFDMINDFGRAGLSSCIATKIFKMGACGSEVSLIEGDQTSTKIEVIDGKEIFGNVDSLFLSQHPGIRIRNDAHVFAIKGVIENVSQIHSLLENVGENFAIIAAEKFFPDVSNTLSENYSSGRLRVIPFEVSDWKVENFLDLESFGISCASSEVGSDISKMKISTKISVQVESNGLIFNSIKNIQKRKISVKFGKELGSLTGISIDRTKTLISLARNSSRGGISECQVGNKKMKIPNYSIEHARKALVSLETNLQNLGGIISIISQEMYHV